MNRVILIGRLGATPELKGDLMSKGAVHVKVATTRKWTDRISGTKKEQTEWHRVVFFRRLAEIALEHLQKGQQIYVEGRIQTNKWQDASGQDRFSTEIVANDLLMLGKKEPADQNMRDGRPWLSKPYDEQDSPFWDDIPF